MIAPTQVALETFLRERIEAGPLGPDELLHLLSPLFEQAIAAHGEGKVAPLDGIAGLQVAEGHAYFSAAQLRDPSENAGRLPEIDHEDSRALEIVSRSLVDETATGGPEVTDLAIRTGDEPVTRPVFLLGYRSWEHEIGQHDPLTDVFSLGLLLASFACAVDLRDREDLERFVRSRGNPAALNERLHPVIGRLIIRMTALSRRERAQDLPGVLSTFRGYREQRIDAPIELRAINGFQVAQRKDPRQILQERLRERLFEISRRNRLLHFKPSLSTLNLTVASVPLLLDYTSISPGALFTWQGSIADALSHEKAVPLGRYLRFEDALYIPSVLDKIRAEDRRNRAEFGFSQLRIAIAFLRWHNLKEEKDERITSPLILLPVTLEKRKGVRDSYMVTPTTDVAEVNPVLRYLLRETYGIELPEAIDLGVTAPVALFEALRSQITASEPGVTLRLIERPQIRLVHERARARLEQYRRSSGAAGRRMRSHGAIDYSYARDSFRPLGLQLFLQRMRPAPLPGRAFLDGPEKASVPMPMVGEPVMERDAYAHVDGSDRGPYTWDFDLCAMTLGNFQYRKISLVRDYNLLLDRESSAHPAFDAIFSLVPRLAEEEQRALPTRRDLATVVPADPTQTTAIVRARRGDSYIIQGPPGTGKSQTITNLIADFVARGQRVLFVCAKRAAIDVVYFRLKQCGLDHLCALIHDSQTDKRDFILGLKTVADRYLQEPDSFEQLERARADLLTRLEAELGALERFSAAMQAQSPHHRLSQRALLDRLVALAASSGEISDAQGERLPGYAEWLDRQATVRELSRTLAECGGAATLATHPLRWVQRAALLADRPIDTIARGLDELGGAIARVAACLREAGFEGSEPTLACLAALAEYLFLVRPVVQAGLERLLSGEPAALAELRASAKAVSDAEAALAQAQSRIGAWRERIPASEVASALEQSRSVKGVFGVFKPTWWRLRKVLQARYDFSQHAVRPTWVALLEALQAFYQAEEIAMRAKQGALQAFATHEPGSLLATVERLLRESTRFEDVRKLLLRGPRGTVLRSLLPFAEAWGDLARAREHVLFCPDGDTLDAVSRRLREVRAALPVLPDLLPHLGRMASEASDELWWAIHHLDRSPDALEAAIAQVAVRDAYRRDRSVMRMTGPGLGEHAALVAAADRELRDLDARWLAAKVHRAFRQNVARSELPTAQVPAEERDWKKRYTRGRRDLEHEFAKVMRYRSIRDLATGESGQVIADLKPVWLMSPLSVSDTLPLDHDFFDVVIYDEASQIPAEEAVPALYRAPKTIVVGDRQQLPPTDFFSSRIGPEEDEEADTEEDAGFELDADSFLTQAAGNLPSTMLSWHYRSRSEALISFSNAAFYQGRLLTIPDCAIAARRAPINAASPDHGFANADRVVDRPVGFHLLSQAPYLERRNPAEATYIAQLLRGLLAKGTGHSIGVVAFSAAQQGQIESALEDLASANTSFRDQLEREYTREEDDQFCGLFVKNLENVQGDERDIIIVSICYGPAADGKMLMNFGPINKTGGERRLNVVFSRAKRHMVVVSSIRHGAITNQYNDGANCLRRYLEFSAAASTGDEPAINRVLETCCPDLSRVRQRAEAVDAATRALAQALVAKGLEVVLGVGASHFRCDLAVRRTGDQRHVLGVLVDTEASYASANPFERWVQRPGLLSSAGWRPMLVLAKDVQEDLRGVVVRIERMLAAGK